jgi:hypothetical protein
MKKQVAIYAIIAVFLTSMVVPSFAGRANAASVSSRTPAHTQILDKSRFVLHVGAAYYAFHHFVYDRFRHKVVQSDGTTTYENQFATGYPHRTANLVKAAVAILFTVHELKVAYQIANTSHSGTLHALVTPINALLGVTSTEYAKLRGCQSGADTGSAAATATPLPTLEIAANATPLAGSGCQYSDKDITNVNSAIDAFSKTSAHQGVTIKDTAVPVPGA